MGNTAIFYGDPASYLRYPIGFNTIKILEDCQNFNMAKIKNLQNFDTPCYIEN